MFDNNVLLKEKLTDIKKNGFEVPQGIDPFELALSMMKNIGSTDPELRDHLIYGTMWRWANSDVFRGNQIKQLLDISMDDEHLFYGVEKPEDDSVFKRAFSVLIAAVAVSCHRKNNILSDEKVREVYKKVMKYYELEKDLRGFVENKGWADATCHGADALDELAMCSALGRDELVAMLNIIRDKTCIGHHSYICEEDERMVSAVVSIINRQVIGTGEIIDWIESFKNAIKERVYPQHLVLISNIKHLLRSLYFRLIDDLDKKEITDAIRESLKLIK
jgi:hypothetical protein